jgi:hypothetical protein
MIAGPRGEMKKARRPSLAVDSSTENDYCMKRDHKIALK